MSPTESVILNTVSDTFKPVEAARACGQTTKSASTTVRRMVDKGLVKKISRGTYQKIRG